MESTFVPRSGDTLDQASRKLRALIALLEERRGSKVLPARADLPVTILRPWLGNLALFDFRSSLGPTFRLCGTALHNRFGGEMTGRPVSDLEAELVRPLLAELESAFSGDGPRRARHFAKSGPQQLAFQDLYLPLRGYSKGEKQVLFASYSEERT